jgi:hypothetical protein
VELVKREWRTGPARLLNVGDNVPGVGLLHQILLVEVALAAIHVDGGLGNRAAFRAEQQIVASTAAGV